MNRKAKFLSILIISIILISSTISLFNNITFAKQTISTDIDGINDKKYPGIKSLIQDLQEEHPNWNFKILYTGLDWEDVIEGEYTGHKKSPSNLVPKGDSYAGNWICSICGTKAYDNGSWYCASEEAIEYMMDPRNSLNSDDVFQFIQLSYADCSYDDIKKMVSNYDYLNSKSVINTIIDVGKDNDVNPYYIVARIIQEQGKGGNVLVTGETYKGNDGVTYSGYYNIFNIKASGNSVSTIYTNGLAYAKEQGWTSLEKSIEGGITTIANNYIKYGQDTLYFQKFNVSSEKYSYYTHQYMQNLIAAQNEGTTMRKTLSEMGYIDGEYTFIIPVYENMPSKACSRPSTTGGLTENDININEDDEQISLTPKVTVEEVIDYLDDVTIKDLNNKKITSGNIGTGYTIEYNKVTYVVIKLGDSTKNGVVDSAELLAIRRYLLGKIKISDKNVIKAMDITQNGEIDSADLLAVQKYLLGKSNISL